MAKFSISNNNYTYVHDHDQNNDPSKVLDVHNIMVKRSGTKALFVYTSALVLLASAFYLYAYEVSLRLHRYLWISICSSNGLRMVLRAQEVIMQRQLDAVDIITQHQVLTCKIP